MLNIFQYHVLRSIKVHEPDYDFIIDHNFYQYQMTLFALFNALCLCLSMFHIVFFFLLVLIFLIYSENICALDSMEKTVQCRSGMGWAEFFVFYLLLSLFFGNTNMYWRYETGEEVTQTHLFALIPCSGLNRELMVLDHLQRRSLSHCLLSLRNHKVASVSEDGWGVYTIPLFKTVGEWQTSTFFFV